MLWQLPMPLCARCVGSYRCHYVHDALPSPVTLNVHPYALSSRKYASKKGAVVNPKEEVRRSPGGRVKLETSHRVIEFDVAVTQTEGGQAKAGLGVFLAPVGLGGQTQYESTGSAANRIKFSVALQLPVQR